MSFLSVVSRFLQEYTEPQPHPSIGSSIFSESQTFNLGSTDAQSVLLPLTEGCLTNNTGVPIVIVCTKVRVDALPLVDTPFCLAIVDCDWRGYVPEYLCFRCPCFFVYEHSSPTTSTIWSANRTTRKKPLIISNSRSEPSV